MVHVDHVEARAPIAGKTAADRRAGDMEAVTMTMLKPKCARAIGKNGSDSRSSNASSLVPRVNNNNKAALRCLSPLDSHYEDLTRDTMHVSDLLLAQRSID